MNNLHPSTPCVNTPISPTVPTLWSILDDGTPPKWTWEALLSLVATDTLRPIINEKDAAMRAAIAPHLGADTPELWEDVCFNALMELAEAAALIGYSLAQTWPTTLVGMTCWPKRAMQYAGLEVDSDARK